MFSQYFKFKKLRITSSASRNCWYFYNKLNLQQKFKKLSLYKKWNAGRNDSGRIVFRTRGSLLRKLRYNNINYRFNYAKIAFVSSFQFIPFKNKLMSLVFFSNGATTQILTTTVHKLFSFFKLTANSFFRKFKIRYYFQFVGKIPKLSFVCNFATNPSQISSYSRAAGTCSKIITIDKQYRVSIIQLSSKIKKITSFFSLAAHGLITGYENRKYSNTKSGYWRAFGLKPIVRGVAKNPVDHPHGGRTKSIKYPKTPWGFTTKYK